MREEDKKSETGGNTLRAVLHFLSGELGAGDRGRALTNRRILFGLVLGIALAADLVTKWAAFRFLEYQIEYRVISGCFSLRTVLNEGIVFGVKAPVLLTIVISITATAVIIWYLITERGRPPVVQLYLGFILSGVIGNLYDRLTIRAVRDFIEFYVGRHHWPNFNLADAFIVTGVVLAMLQFILTGDKKEEKPGKEAGTKSAGKSARKAGN